MTMANVSSSFPQSFFSLFLVQYSSIVDVSPLECVYGRGEGGGGWGGVMVKSQRFSSQKGQSF